MSRGPFLFYSGIKTVLMPARCAASSFSLMPPTGRTRPRSEISPVIASPACTGTPRKSETIAVSSVTPADRAILRRSARRKVDVKVRGVK